MNASLFGGVVPNPLASEFDSQYRDRLEWLFEAVSPVLCGNMPQGIARDSDSPAGWRPESDSECQTITFDLVGQITLTGIEGIEDRTADELEQLAAECLKIAGTLRSGVAARIENSSL